MTRLTSTRAVSALKGTVTDDIATLAQAFGLMRTYVTCCINLTTIDISAVDGELLYHHSTVDAAVVSSAADANVLGAVLAHSAVAVEHDDGAETKQAPLIVR